MNIQSPSIMPLSAATGLTSLAAPPATRAELTGGEAFSAAMANFLRDSARTLRAGEAVALKGVTGAAPTQDVVEAIMAAEQALQSAVAIRDKVVSAYIEISRMAI